MLCRRTALPRPKSHFGGRRPKHFFFLNPYRDVRFTRCPKCQRLTKLRKFALLIHVDGFGLISLGKTSRFCGLCEIIIIHQDELEPEIARVAPDVILNQMNSQYVVIGTLPLSIWKASLRNRFNIETVRNLTADFKDQLKFSAVSNG